MLHLPENHFLLRFHGIGEGNVGGGLAICLRLSDADSTKLGSAPRPCCGLSFGGTGVAAGSAPVMMSGCDRWWRRWLDYLRVSVYLAWAYGLGFLGSPCARLTMSLIGTGATVGAVPAFPATNSP